MTIIDISASNIREKLLQGKVKAIDIVKAYLKRIKEDEDARVLAFLEIDEEGAFQKAKEIDKKIKEGKEIGRLAGIPIAIKDNISMKGLNMTCGSKMMEDYTAPFDASLIKKIKEEDGIILGKTNMDEFAVGSSTEGSYYGITNNPINKDIVPGGSSGGSAAAVGSRQVLLAVGTDTGGSVRQPASFCNVVGMKPSYGTISRYGVVSMANSLDQAGVLGNSVDEVALLLSILMDYDSKDSTSYKKAGNILEGLDLFKDYSLAGKKIAIPLEIINNLDGKILEKFKDIISHLEKEGAEITEINMESLELASACYHIISTAELSSNIARYDGIIFGHRSKNYEDLTELYINSRSESIGLEVKRRILFGNYVLSKDNREKYYEKSLKVRRLIWEEFKKVFEKYDFILSPTSPNLPFKLGENSEDTELQYNSDMFTVPVNLGGFPAISLPSGFIDGLPFGVQLVGDMYQDRQLLEAGLAYERSFTDDI